MKLHLKKWFAGVYRTREIRFRVGGEYNAIKSSRHMLADIAARNFVFAQLPDEPHAMAIAEGRRRAALEIIQLAGVDPHELAHVEFSLPGDPATITRRPNNAAI